MSAKERNDIHEVLNAPLRGFKPLRSFVVRLAATLAMVILVVGGILGWVSITERRNETISHVEKRLAVAASGRAQTIATWLDGTLRVAARVTDSELFRLFATELSLSDEGLAPQDKGISPSEEETFADASLTEQLPYMEQILSEFSTNVDFVSSTLVVRGQRTTTLSSAGAAPLSADLMALARESLREGWTIVGPGRSHRGILIVDLSVPVFEPASSESGTGDPEVGAAVGAFVFTVPLGVQLVELLGGDSLLKREAGISHLLQRNTQGLLEELTPQGIKTLEMRDDLGALPFFLRGSALSGGPMAYLAASEVKDTPWFLVQELPAQVAEAGLLGFQRWVFSLAGVLAVALISGFAAILLRQSSSFNHAMADQYHGLARRIETQKQLLDNINSSIIEHVGLKDREGRYLFANSALAAAVKRDSSEIVGLDDRALYGEATAQRLAAADSLVLEKDCVIVREEVIYFAQQARHMHISKAPWHVDAGGEVMGVVSVARDITAEVEERARRERAVRQTVAALVRAVELRDPYLAGHSKRVTTLAKDIGKRLNLCEQELNTLEIAANLSQLGKLAIPRTLLTKPGRLTEEETAIVQRHVSHARTVLRDIDFELPVLQTIEEMNERIDGQGYPLGLQGSAISCTAQILGMVDWFCARIEPRAHRPGLLPEQALEILQAHPQRYASDLVKILHSSVTSTLGEKLVASVASMITSPENLN